jgi:hypothetical protein
VYADHTEAYIPRRTSGPSGLQTCTAFRQCRVNRGPFETRFSSVRSVLIMVNGRQRGGIPRQSNAAAVRPGRDHPLFWLPGHCSGQAHVGSFLARPRASCLLVFLLVNFCHRAVEISAPAEYSVTNAHESNVLVTDFRPDPKLRAAAPDRR